MTAAFYDAKTYDRPCMEAAGGGALTWHFQDFRLTAGTAQTAAGAEAVCVFVNDRVDRACLRILQGCGVKLVALRCAGFNNVDLEAAKELGIAVTRVPAYSPHAVAEHTVALLLTLNRRIHSAFNRVREHNFSLNGLVGFDLFGKTAGIVGTGKIGRLTAQIFRGFGMRVLASDPAPEEEWALENGVEYVPFHDLLAASDVVSLHSPLTPETFHLLNEHTLPLLKTGAWLLNTSRGKLIETAALLTNLKNGHLGGVALDVYEEEEGVFFEDRSGAPLEDDSLTLLLAYPNVLVTSHQGFLTREALAEIARVTVENIRRLATEDFLESTRLI